MIKRIFLYIILLFVINISGFSQTESKFRQNKSISVSYHYGWLLPEYSFNTLQAIEPIHGAEISLEKHSSGSNYWQRLYKYPVTGISLFYSGLSNPEIYGKQGTIYGYTGSSFMQNNKINIFWKLGLGFTYTSEKFDFHKNRLNVAIGSNYNVYFRAAMGWQTHISNSFVFKQSLDFSHISNINMNEPNIGLNWLTFNNTILFLPKGKPLFDNPEIPEHQKRLEHQFFLSGGLKHTKTFEPYQYITGSFSYNLSYKPSHIIGLGIGADFFYDSSVKNVMKDKEYDYLQKYSWHTGIHAELKLTYNRLSLGLQQGVYLGLKETINNNIVYNRSFMQWKLNDNVLLMLALKSHIHILDHVQIGVGYTLNQKLKK